MPFRSAAQRAYLHANEPELAERWEREYPVDSLPARAVKPKEAKAKAYARALRKK